MFVVSIFTSIDYQTNENKIATNNYPNACVVANRYSNANLEGVDEYAIYITNEETGESRCFYEVNNR